jgi:internalin A
MSGKLFRFLAIGCFLTIIFASTRVQAVEIKNNRVVDTNKIWSINFNHEIVLEGNLDKIFVKDSLGNLVKDIKIDLGADGKSIIINPPSSGYTYGENFTLTVSSEFQSKGSKRIKEDIIVPFSVGETVKELHSFYPSGVSFGPKTEAFIKSVDSLSFAWSNLILDNSSSGGSVKLYNSYDNALSNDMIKALKYARANGKSTQLNIFADDNGSDTYMIISNILPYSDKRQALISKIIYNLEAGVNIGESNPFKFDGVVIDFEGLKNGTAVEGKLISEWYNEFLKEIRDKLDNLATKKKLYVAANVDMYYTGYDYAAITRYADKLILMAHDYEPTGNINKYDVMKYINYDPKNPINSLAPAVQVEKALKSTVQGLYGKELKKIWLQISFDSAQWQFKADVNKTWEEIDGYTSSISHDVPEYSAIKERLYYNINGINLESKYIKELQSPYITYYNTAKGTYNFILYEDSRSVQAKIDAANKYGIGGISLWQWGNVPNYDDSDGRKYYLDVWQQILKKVKKINY